MTLFEDHTRLQHFIVGIQTAVIFTILCTLGAMTAAEWKDRAWGGLWDWKDWWGGKADWRDWVCTMLGGLVGQAVQVLIVYLILK